MLLVLDVSGQSQTAAAVAKGFATYDPAVPIAGVVLNRVGSERHRRLAGDAIEAIGLPVVGAILRDPTLTLPERHLGLVQAGEHARLRRISTGWPTWWSARSTSTRSWRWPRRSCAGGGFFRRAAAARPAHRAGPGRRLHLPLPACGAAWRAAGAESCRSRRSPTRRRREDCDVCWLPGGYPELHAGTLAAARDFRAGMQKFAATKPVHGECGGFMVLGEALEDADGETPRMLGLLGHATSFAKRKMNLGYRQAQACAPIARWARPATIVRGHEFHYAQMIAPGADEPLAELADGQGSRSGLPAAGAAMSPARSSTPSRGAE